MSEQPKVPATIQMGQTDEVTAFAFQIPSKGQVVGVHIGAHEIRFCADNPIIRAAQIEQLYWAAEALKCRYPIHDESRERFDPEVYG